MNITKIYLETSSDIVENEVKVPMQTYVALFIYQYLEVTDSLQIYLIINTEKSTSSNDDVTIDVSQINNLKVLTNHQFNSEIASLCNLPVLVTHEAIVIAGLCGVCRGIIKHSGNSEAIQELLGFKQGCLLAPSESSIWTKFCEIDMIKCCQQMLQLSECNEIELPEEFARFESHMSQPIRVHNVYKLARTVANEKHKQKTTETEAEKLIKNLSINKNSTPTKEEKVPRINKTRNSKLKKNPIQIASSTPIDQLNLEHTFVEGQQITLADLILYSCFFLCYKICKPSALRSIIPFTEKWMDAMQTNLLNDRRQKCENILKLVRPQADRETVYKIQPMTGYSLYKNDPKRYKPKNRVFTKQDDIEQSLVRLEQLNLSIKSQSNENDIENSKIFQWGNLPYEALPEGGALPASRLARKKHQLQSLVIEILSIAQPGQRIVDFCSGAGHLGIILAYLLPECEIILLENKEESLGRAKQRVDLLQLKNVLFFQCNLDYFCGSFDIGTALHACGVATDIVLWHCLQRQANFVCCPCCYGKVVEMPHISYPRSKLYRSAVSTADYLHFAHCADQAHDIEKGPCNEVKSRQGQLCMDIVDWDRKLLAEECGYRTVKLSRLFPENCTPKNRLLVGIF